MLPLQGQLLQEEQARCANLATQLSQQQAAAAERVAELEARAEEQARLSEVAHSSTEELLQAREALQQERARAEALAQERAELHGRVRDAPACGMLALATGLPYSAGRVE